MFYVSYITEYPIYEPAEGGYYYAGENVEKCIAFSSWKKANKLFQKWRKEFKEMHDDEPERIHDADHGGVGKYVNPAVYYHARYIGDGEYIQITRKEPQGKGWTPYC